MRSRSTSCRTIRCQLSLVGCQLSLLTFFFFSASCSRPAGEDKPRFAFVTNNSSNFWNIARKGIEKAQAELPIAAEFRVPLTGQVAEQQKIIEDLIAKGVDGMAISPIDPANMGPILNQAARKMILITHDSDAPRSERRVYIGTNNYKAGEAAGGLLREVLPDGGDIILFVGSLDVQNAQERKAGLEDAIQGTNIRILETRLDAADHAKAQENAESAIVAYPQLSAMAGLWSYNGPTIAAAVKAAGKAQRIKIVCFDEEEETLNAIKEGLLYGTVVQKPYEFGYRSMRMLYELYKGNNSVIPPDKTIDTGVEIVKKENVDAFWAKLRKLQQ